jgi:hypothetical protein
MRRSEKKKKKTEIITFSDWLFNRIGYCIRGGCRYKAILTLRRCAIVAPHGEPDVPEVVLEQPQSEKPSPPEDLGPEGNTPLQPDSGPPSQSWDGESRVSMLVMGLDYRDYEGGAGAPRTDTMILLSIDPTSQTAGMLSIPRDLWVEIPGYEPAKINQAYRDGNYMMLKVAARD